MSLHAEPPARRVRAMRTTVGDGTRRVHRLQVVLEVAPLLGGEGAGGAGERDRVSAVLRVEVLLHVADEGRPVRAVEASVLSPPLVAHRAHPVPFLLDRFD